MQVKRHRFLALFIICSIIAVAFLWLGRGGTPIASRSIKVATAKGGVVGVHMLAPSLTQLQQRDATLDDPAVAPMLAGKEYELLGFEQLGVSASASYTCTDCVQITFYNYTDGGTVHAVRDEATGNIIEAWENREARPYPGSFIVDEVVEIAADDSRVRDVLGDLRKAEVAMVPMSTWLTDDDCSEDWCVDLTFHDPAQTGKIYHIVVNMEQQQVARTFFTRARQERATPFDQLSDSAPLFTDGCYESAGWEVCWEMTAHDGLNIYEADFEGTRIFDSAKIGQVEAYYAAWPGGYRDEIGHTASVPPKFDTRVTDVEGGFEIRQLFTEPFNWPNCICCYRYEQIMTFFETGGFEPKFISHGPGCDDLAEYRPFWRFDLALDGDDDDEVWQWDEVAWKAITGEVDLSLFSTLSLAGERLATFDGDLHYRWQPELSDPLGLDEGRLFVVTGNTNEGERGIEAGPADSYEPVRTFVDGDDLTDAVLWYVPVLKTKKGGPWWCAPDPDPEFSPCEAVMQVLPGSELTQPTAEELALLQPDADGEDETAAAPPTLDPATPLATRKPTPRPIAGETAEEIILNSGCGACHLIGEAGEGGKVGPDLSNIGNVAAERVPGQSAQLYLYNSIIYPNLFIVPECPNGDCLPNVMPSTYYLTLSDTQVQTMIDYLLTLREAPGDGDAMTADNEPTITNDQPPAAEQTDPTNTPASQSDTPTQSNAALVLSIIGGVAAMSILIGLLLARRRNESE